MKVMEEEYNSLIFNLMHYPHDLKLWRVDKCVKLSLHLINGTYVFHYNFFLIPKLGIHIEKST